jgi:hypothetical protein
LEKEVGNMKRFFAAASFILASSLLSINTMAQMDSLPNDGGLGPTNGVDWHLPKSPNFPELDGRSNHRPVLPEARVLKKGPLAPAVEDRVSAAAFLRTRNTGLIRLLPREVYGRVLQRGKVVLGDGGAYYSFTYISHEYGYGSDIELQMGKLSVGFAGYDFGMLTKLGDVPLEAISRQDARATFLLNYDPPSDAGKARAEARRFGNLRGVTIDGVIYSRRLPVEVNTTYLLRSIVYDATDVLVALRVVRKDTDGSVIIAWKLLKNYGVPGLTRGR